MKMKCNCDSCAFAGYANEYGDVQCLENEDISIIWIPCEVAEEECPHWGQRKDGDATDVSKVTLDQETIVFTRNSTVWDEAGNCIECDLVMEFDDSTWDRIEHLRDENIAVSYIEDHIELNELQELYLKRYIGYLIQGEPFEIIPKVIVASRPDLAAAVE